MCGTNKSYSNNKYLVGKNTETFLLGLSLATRLFGIGYEKKSIAKSYALYTNGNSPSAYLYVNVSEAQSIEAARKHIDRSGRTNIYTHTYTFRKASERGAMKINL